MQKLAFIFIISLLGLKLPAQKLKTSTNETINFKQLNDTVLVVFYHFECPICQKYSKTLREFQAKENIKIYTVLNDKYLKTADIQVFTEEYGFKPTYVLDPKKKLVKKLKAKVTPEVFLFVKNKIIYSGAIDNWFYDLGKGRPQPTEFYLLDAYSALKSGKQIKVAKTEAVGCDL